MNLYEFFGYEENDSVHVYVRARDEDEVRRIVVEHWGWREGHDDDETDPEIIAYRCGDGPEEPFIRLVKTYPAPGPEAGSISYSECERILHEVL